MFPINHEEALEADANMEIKRKCIDFLKWYRSEECESAIWQYTHKYISKPDEEEIYRLFIQSNG